MPLTRIQLVDHVLDMAGLDSNYRTKGRNWLNIVLEKIANRHDYSFYNKLASSVSFVAGQTTYPVPSDFDRPDSCFWYDSAGNKGGEILIVEPYDFDQVQISYASFPTHAMIDDENQQIIFNAAPADASGRSYKLRYYRAAEALSTDSTDDNVIPDFDDQDVLIQELTAMAYEHANDEREDKKKNETKMAHVEHRRQSGMTEDPHLSLDRNVFRKRSRS